jgi:hypothetical protein
MKKAIRTGTAWILSLIAAVLEELAWIIGG